MRGKCKRCKKLRDITKKDKLCKPCANSVRKWNDKTYPAFIGRLEKRVGSAWRSISDYIPAEDDI